MPIFSMINITHLNMLNSFNFNKQTIDKLSFQVFVPTFISQSQKFTCEYQQHKKQVIHFSRRSFLHTFSSLLLPFNNNFSDSQQVYKLIIDNCQPYIQHLNIHNLSLHNILWRGASTTFPVPVIYIKPPSDLLDETTYGSQGAKFFKQFDEINLAGKVHPRQAHIATADQNTAALWGVPVSIWPVGEFQFCFWEKRKLIYDDDDSLQMALRKTGHLIEQRNLQLALKNGKEVMFEADGFLEIREDILKKIISQFDAYS